MPISIAQKIHIMEQKFLGVRKCVILKKASIFSMKKGGKTMEASSIPGLM